MKILEVIARHQSSTEKQEAKRKKKAKTASSNDESHSTFLLSRDDSPTSLKVEKSLGST